MNIFNSLGSNYNLQFALKALFSRNNNGYSLKLKSLLEKKYQGKAVLVYKGREAIELALQLLNLPPKTSVGINGFTCFAVYKAIVNAGYKPLYLDIKDRNLNFTSEKLEFNASVRVVIIQNTLGAPCDIDKIKNICQKNNIILIEDLAHSVGTVYKNGKEAGTLGDFTALSFSQDKMIDGVSGGALIIRNKDYQREKAIDFKKVSQKQQIIDRFYPIFTNIIRATYSAGLGKIIHEILKKTNLLSNPMGKHNNKNICVLPHWYCNLSFFCFRNLPANLSHRKEIAQIYAKIISPELLSPGIVSDIPFSTNLRFPVFVDNRSDLINFLKKNGIYVSDIWYDAPIAPKKYLSLTDYKSQCSEAEKISQQILNLPTHQNISKKQANEIAERINLWQTLQ